jgi:hypothetical protein
MSVSHFGRAIASQMCSGIKQRPRAVTMAMAVAIAGLHPEPKAGVIPGNRLNVILESL